MYAAMHIVMIIANSETFLFARDIQHTAQVHGFAAHVAGHSFMTLTNVEAGGHDPYCDGYGYSLPLLKGKPHHKVISGIHIIIITSGGYDGFRYEATVQPN